MINIAKLLKNCPKGTKLYSPLFGEVELIGVNNDSTKIRVIYNQCFPKDFLSDGRYLDFPDAECLLFPSSSCRDWKKWKAPTSPKFKVHDWIIYDKSFTIPIQVIDIKDKVYVCKSIEGLVDNYGIKITDSEYHLWTIADATDGDILVSDLGNPFIYNGKTEFSFLGAYVGISRNGEIRLDIFPSTSWTSMNNVSPATKEQQELLFTKIKEIGYEWDEKKKGLRKTIVPKFKIGDWLYHNTLGIHPILIKDYSELQGYKVEGLGRTYYVQQGIIENEYHLWTMADAKDGDVLAMNWQQDDASWEKIIIFKKYHTKGVKGLFNRPCVEGYGDTFKNGKLALYEDVPYYSQTWTDNLHPATTKQRNLLFQKMKENGCAWDAEKKELKKIKPRYDILNFKPKQWVLVRDDDEWEWALTRFSHLSNGSASLFVCINGASFQQCIPFEGNEHLLGTTDMPSEEYINW